ncbi:hypothetical protein [Caldisericum sp.]|uniref:portal protein n=1 Tax=Caldisericum sp. TaxID=2499687 RepID=UPI003D0CB66E
MIAKSKTFEYWVPNKQDNSSETELENRYFDIINNIESVYDYFYDKFQIAERNLRYYKGEQWTPEELIAHKKQFRRAYVFNEIFSKVDHIIGTQTQTRMEINVIPREKEDGKQAEILGHLVKWVEQVNDFKIVETNVFTDAIIRGFGVSGISWKFEDVLFGYPQIQVFPAWQFFWDLNSCELDLSDARWMARVQYLPRKTLKELFPQNEEQIDEISKTFGKFNFDFPYWIQPDKRQYLDKTLIKEYELLPLIEYYDWSLKNVYIVVDNIRGKNLKFENGNDAKEFAQGLIDAYAEENRILWTSDGDPRVFVNVVQDRIYKQCLIIGDQIISDEEIATPFFPYDICFAYFNQGDFWSLVDQLISPQDLINRAFSQLDYHLGTSVKGALTIVRSMLDKSFGLEDLRQEWSKTTPIIPVLDHNAIRQLQFSTVPPQLFDEVNFGIQRLVDYVGGRNILGFTEKAGESGKAVQERAQQAGISRMPLFDKLQIWRKSVGEKIIWYLQNIMEDEQILKIIGNDDTLEYVPLNKELVNSLKEISYDVVVDETAATSYVKEKYFKQLLALFQQFPTAPEVIVPTLIQFSDLPESQKKDILSKLEFYQQYMQMKQQQQHEENIRKQAEDVVKRKMIRQQLQTQLQVPERLQ